MILHSYVSLPKELAVSNIDVFCLALPHYMGREHDFWNNSAEESFREGGWVRRLRVRDMLLGNHTFSSTLWKPFPWEWEVRKSSTHGGFKWWDFPAHIMSIHTCMNFSQSNMRMSYCQCLISEVLLKRCFASGLKHRDLVQNGAGMEQTVWDSMPTNNALHPTGFSFVVQLVPIAKCIWRWFCQQTFWFVLWKWCKQ